MDLTWAAQLVAGTNVALFIPATATLDTNLWFERTSPYLETADTVELWLGTYERCLSTCYSTNHGVNATLTTTSSNLAYSGNDGSGLTWLTETGSGTNYVAVTNTYAARQADAVSTTTYPWYSDPGGTFLVPPPTFTNTVWIQDTNKYIWGAYTNYTATGFSNANANQTYTWYQRDVGMRWVSQAPTAYGKSDQVDALRDWYVATNGYTLIDEGAHYGWNALWQFRLFSSLFDTQGPLAFYISSSGHYASNGAHIYYTDQCRHANVGPWRTSHTGFIAPGASVTNGALMADKLRDAYTMDKYGRVNALGPYMPRIDPHGIASPVWERYLWMMMSSRFHVYGSYALGAAVFADMNSSTNGTFLNVTNKPFPTFSMSSFSDQDPVSFAHTNWYAITNHFNERYDALQQMQWTVGGGASHGYWQKMDPYWIAGNGANSNHWVWSISTTDSWLQAQVDLVNDTPTATRVNGPPMIGIRANQNPPGKWNIVAETRMSALTITGLYSEIDHDIEFYNKGQPGLHGYEGTNAVFDNDGEIVGTNIFMLWQDYGSTDASIVTSAVLGRYTICDMPAEPGTGGVWTSRGFHIDDEEYIAKWAFSNCVEARP